MVLAYTLYTTQSHIAYVMVFVFSDMSRQTLTGRLFGFCTTFEEWLQVSTFSSCYDQGFEEVSVYDLVHVVVHMMIYNHLVTIMRID